MTYDFPQNNRYHPDKNKEEGAEEKFVEIAHGELFVYASVSFD